MKIQEFQYANIVYKIKDRIFKLIKQKYSALIPLYEVDCVLSPYNGHALEEILVNVTRLCYVEHVGTKTVTATGVFRTPATWYDHLKQTYPWLVNIFGSVKYHTETFEKRETFSVDAAFPDYVPPQGMRPYITIKEMIL